MYCLKCKKKTETKDQEETTSKNNRKMLKGICVVCGTHKSQFIKGKGIINKAINNMPFEMHLPNYNFAGPGTKLNKRLNPDLTPKEPINRVDEAAMHHDICYLKNKDTKTRNEVCDKNMLRDLNILNPSIRERIDKSIVGNLIKAKMAFGMGNI
jgi:hypothetical protein